MIVNLHTPSGIIKHELSQKELEQLAEKGNRRTRIEIAKGKVSAGIDLKAKTDLVLWVLGIQETGPKIQKEI